MNAETILLAIVAAIGAGYFTAIYHQPVWILLLPCLAAPWWRIERLPVRAVSLLRLTGRAVCVAVVVLGVFLSQFPLNPEFGMRRTPVNLGYVVTLLISVFLLGWKIWPAGSALIPLLLSLLALDCYRQNVNMLIPVAASTVCLAAYLIVTSGRAASRVRLLRLAVLALVAAAIGWGVSRGLWWSLDWTENNINGLFTQLSTSAPNLMADSQLGSLAELKLSSKVVLRAWSERPQKLRARAFPEFDGRTWHAPSQVAPAVRAEGGRYLLDAGEPRPVTTRILTVHADQPLILAPAGALNLTVDGDPGLRMDDYRALTWAPGAKFPERYVIEHRRNGRVLQFDDGGTREACLKLPRKLDPRVRDLAMDLAKGAASPEQRLRRTLDFLQTGYSYSLSPGKFHTRDPLAEFLFEKRRGYCEYFATAAAILLRLQGVPARYVTGYSVQAGNRVGDHYVVREKDAHAWIEAYIPGAGWVEADPTPPAEYEAMAAGASATWFDRAWESVQAVCADLWSRVHLRDLLWFALATAAAVMAVRLWRRRRKRVPTFARERPLAAAALDPALAGLLSALDRYWTSLGRPRPASRGLLEHAESLPEALRVASMPAVECFYRGCFAAQAVDAKDLASARRTLESQLAAPAYK